jgi:hypothetical protein
MAKHTETPRSGHPIEALLCSLRDQIAGSVDLPAWSMDAETTTRVVTLAAQVAAGVAELEARAVGQAQAHDLPGQTGCTSTTRWLQNTTHVTHATAKAKVDLANALDDAEATRTAMATGGVHAEQAVAIGTHLDRLDTEAVSAEQKHSAEAFLVEHASAHDAHDLSRMGDAIWSHLDPDGWEAREAALLEAQEERARAKTTFSMRDDGDGMTHGRFSVPTLAGAMLCKQLQALAAPKHVRATQGAGSYKHEVPSPSKYGQAFVEWIETLKPEHLPKIGGLNATVIAIGDYDLLVGKVKAACLDTGEKLSPTEYLRLACGAEIIPMRMNASGEVLAVGRKHRFHTETQRQAAIVERRHCEHPSVCDVPGHLCHLHHQTPWAEGGETTLRDAKLLCPFHHRHVHTHDTSQRNHPLRT